MTGTSQATRANRHKTLESASVRAQLPIAQVGPAPEQVYRECLKPSLNRSRTSQ